jgi:hypothetical protein
MKGHGKYTQSYPDKEKALPGHPIEVFGIEQ